VAQPESRLTRGALTGLSTGTRLVLQEYHLKAGEPKWKKFITTWRNPF